MDKFLSDQRLLAFLGALLVAICSWGLGFATWPEMFKPNAIFGLLGILGSLLLSNVTSNILKPVPTITETVEPKSQVTVTTTTVTPPEGKP
jgi:hypothetical protein